MSVGPYRSAPPPPRLPTLRFQWRRALLPTLVGLVLGTALVMAPSALAGVDVAQPDDSTVTTLRWVLGFVVAGYAPLGAAIWVLARRGWDRDDAARKAELETTIKALDAQNAQARAQESLAGAMRDLSTVVASMRDAVDRNTKVVNDALLEAARAPGRSYEQRRSISDAAFKAVRRGAPIPRSEEDDDRERGGR